jgi:hypothetical protein
MNCQEVQAQLSDYLEKSLDAANLEIIETHLSSCLICRTEADNLAECIREVAALPMLDPPIGFTQRVMAHVREIEDRPRSWQRLFFPLQIKIPIQATAVVLIGIFAVYLFQKEQPDKQSLSNSASTVAIDRTPNQANQLMTGSNPLEDARPRWSFGNGPAVPRDQWTSNENEMARVDKTKSPTEKRNENRLPSQPSVESKGPIGGLISGIPVVNTGTGSSFSPPPEFGNGSLRPGSMSIEPFADYELVFRPRVRPQAERQAPSSILDRLPSDNSNPQTVWFSVPQNQYEQFKKDLSAAGTIESEVLVPLLRKEGLSQAGGQLQIKVTVLPVAETNQGGPGSPSDR